MHKCSEWAKLPSGAMIRFSKMELAYSDDGNIANADASSSRTTFVCIPGNPGNEHFYAKFGEHLMKMYAKRMEEKEKHRHVEFISIAHVNHVPLVHDNKNTIAAAASWQHNERFSLEDQIRLKLEFCENFLKYQCADDGHRVYLVGHSIGAYISLRMLPHLVDNIGWNIVSCFCLFPTVEHMAETPNGVSIGPLVKIVDRFDWLLLHMFALFHFIPYGIKRWMCQKFLNSPKTPECVLNAAIELADPLVFRNIAHMTKHELQEVRVFDHSLLIPEQHKDRLVFFYGLDDKWAPIEFAERMRERMPEMGRVLVDATDHGFEHAFVLEHSREMAELLVEMICLAT